jgi:hypothetical protein
MIGGRLSPRGQAALQAPMRKVNRFLRQGKESMPHCSNAATKKAAAPAKGKPPRCE